MQRLVHFEAGGRMTPKTISLLAGGCVAALIGGVFALLLIGGVVVAQAVPNANQTAVGLPAPPPPLGQMVVVPPTLLPGVPPGGYLDYFPAGECTYWAAKNHLVTWNGNAWQWYGAALEQGITVIPTPKLGAIVVWGAGLGGYSDVGHVAIVVATTATSYTVSEMNYAGFGIVDERTVSWPDSAALGFIP